MKKIRQSLFMLLLLTLVLLQHVGLADGISWENYVHALLYASTQTQTYTEAIDFLQTTGNFYIDMNMRRAIMLDGDYRLYIKFDDIGNITEISSNLGTGEEKINYVINLLNSEFGDSQEEKNILDITEMAWSYGQMEIVICPSYKSGYNARDCYQDMFSGKWDFCLQIRNPIKSRLQCNKYLSKSNFDENKFTIRSGLLFGMNEEEVVNIEGKPQVINSGELIYSTSAAGMNAQMYLYFADGHGLYRIGYIFSESHLNDNLYINDYESLQKSLEEKYGHPYINSKTWNRSLYKDDEEKYGFAVSIGDLTYAASWNIGNVKIYHALSGDNNKINHLLFYQKNNADEIENQSYKYDGI